MSEQIEKKSEKGLLIKVPEDKWNEIKKGAAGKQMTLKTYIIWLHDTNMEELSGKLKRDNFQIIKLFSGFISFLIVIVIILQVFMFMFLFQQFGYSI